MVRKNKGKGRDGKAWQGKARYESGKQGKETQKFQNSGIKLLNINAVLRNRRFFIPGLDACGITLPLPAHLAQVDTCIYYPGDNNLSGKCSWWGGRGRKSRERPGRTEGSWSSLGRSPKPILGTGWEVPPAQVFPHLPLPGPPSQEMSPWQAENAQEEQPDAGGLLEEPKGISTLNWEPLGILLV